MYNDYFKFTHSPFSQYAVAHDAPAEKALAGIIYAVHRRKGLVVLTGSRHRRMVVIDCLLDFCAQQNIEFASILYPSITADQLYELIGRDLALDCTLTRRHDVVLSLLDYCEKRSVHNSTTVLVLDEAQLLTRELLEELKLLHKLTNRRRPLLQIILGTEQGFRETLQLLGDQEVAVTASWVQVYPMSCEETIDYINNCLKAAGADSQNYISRALMERIHLVSHGEPRLVNAICDHLLLTLFAMEERVTRSAMLDEVLRDMQLFPSRSAYTPIHIPDQGAPPLEDTEIVLLRLIVEAYIKQYGCGIDTNKPGRITVHGPHGDIDLKAVDADLKRLVSFKLVQVWSQSNAWSSIRPTISGLQLLNGTTARPLSVFICHTSADKGAVRKLYWQLLDEGVRPWLDEEQLLPGQEFDLEIKRALQRSDVVLVCISENAVNKRGYVQKELKYVLDLSDEQPEGEIFLIPVRLEECDLPERVKKLQYVDLFRDGGYQRLIRALHACLPGKNARIEPK